MAFVFFMIGLLLLWTLNGMVWYGTWNLIARLILKFFPDTDLRILQRYKSRRNREGEMTQVPVHTLVQEAIFVVLSIGCIITIFISSSYYINALFR